MKRIIVLLLFAFSLHARELTDADRKSVATLVPHLLDTMYVIPEKGRELANAVRASFTAGRYDAAKTAQELADLINADLAPANDRHLGVRFNPAKADAPAVTIEQWQERRAQMRAGGGTPMTPDREKLRLVNFGIAGARVLEGNVGYLEIREFMQTDETRKAIDAALQFLANTDAVIVDVRNCPGGSGDTVAYLASYFFADDNRVLMNRFHRPSSTSHDSVTRAVPGKRLPDVPLFVVTSNRSGSACESFAFTLQQWGRAQTVGENSAGAGFNNMFIDLGLGMTLSVSIGTATHPKTKKQFEKVGVVPDIPAPAESALEAAHQSALKALKRSVASSAIDPTAEVKLLERAWLDAYEQRDAAAMARIVADDFTITHDNGRTETKSDVMAMISAPRAGGRSAKFFTEGVNARAYGDTVVLTGIVTMEAPRRDGTTSRKSSRYTDTYVRRNGRWQVVSSHLSPVGEHAPAVAVSTPSPAIKLDDYVGNYGVREITMRDGTLHFQRKGAHGGALKPIGTDRFDLNGDVVVSFARDNAGAVSSMVIEWKDGRRETVPREPR